MTFQLPPDAAAMHGLAFFDGTTSQLSAMPLTPPDQHLATDRLLQSAGMSLSPTSTTTARAIALSVQDERGPAINRYAAVAINTIAHLSAPEVLQTIHARQGRIG